MYCTLLEVKGRQLMFDDGVLAKLSLSSWNFGCAPFVVIYKRMEIEINQANINSYASLLTKLCLLDTDFD